MKGGDRMNRGYEDLGNAIILQAVKDWKNGYRREEVERFFYSQWFKTLTNIDPDYIMKICRDDSITPTQISRML